MLKIYFIFVFTFHTFRVLPTTKRPQFHQSHWIKYPVSSNKFM